MQSLDVALLLKNLFMLLAVRRSSSKFGEHSRSYSCTRLSTRTTLTHISCSQNFPRAPIRLGYGVPGVVVCSSVPPSHVCVSWADEINYGLVVAVSNDITSWPRISCPATKKRTVIWPWKAPEGRGQSSVKLQVSSLRAWLHEPGWPG